MGSVQSFDEAATQAAAAPGPGGETDAAAFEVSRTLTSRSGIR